MEGHKSHLAVLVLAHFGVQLEWMKACFSPWYFPNGKRILITYMYSCLDITQPIVPAAIPWPGPVSSDLDQIPVILNEHSHHFMRDNRKGGSSTLANHLRVICMYVQFSASGYDLKGIG